MDTRAKALELSELQYSYKSEWLGPNFHALKGITVDVYEGESFGFLGHNGAGKTTSIKCILGLIRPSSGSIKIFGKDWRDTEARQSVGYLPEQPYFYDHLTVREIMEMYAHLTGVPSHLMNSHITEALDLVKVSQKAKSPMRALSKGLTQRVAMAQAIVGKPRLLVLDEPFSGLDPIGRKEFRDLLLHLKSSKTTIFMSSHILSDVEYLCERASIMAYGELKGVYTVKDIPRLSQGTYEIVVRECKGIETRLIELSDSFETREEALKLITTERVKAEKALSLVVSSAAKLESYQFVQGNLEELFVKLVKFDEAGTNS